MGKKPPKKLSHFRMAADPSVQTKKNALPQTLSGSPKDGLN